MSERPENLLDTRSQDERLEQIREILPAYVPGWEPGETGPGAAVLNIFAKLLQVATERLNAAPLKNKLAFLDRMGVDLLSARPARAPVVFKAIEGGGHGSVPDQTRLGAQPTDPADKDPLYFQTESAVGLADANLVECITVVPAGDSYADHSQAAMGQRDFSLFEGQSPIAHELYIGHETLFAFDGAVTVELKIELSMPGRNPTAWVWEYWDGEVWRGFLEFSADGQDGGQSYDGTEGLTRNGIVRLVSDCASSESVAVKGIDTCWLRARLPVALPPTEDAQRASIDRILARLTHENRIWDILELDGDIAGTTSALRDEDGMSLDAVFTHSSDMSTGDERVTVTSEYAPYLEYFPSEGYTSTELDAVLRPGVTPDALFADGSKLDASKAFAPFSEQPRTGACFYLLSDELFAKVGAIIRLHARSSVAQGFDLGDKDPTLGLELWNGRRWRGQALETGELLSWIKDSGEISFVVPPDLETTEVNGEEGLWIRLRILSGTFQGTQTVEWQEDGASTPATITLNRIVAPIIEDLRMGFSEATPWATLEHVLTHNDFAWHSASAAAQETGGNFEPFRATEDRRPALYLGFADTLPADSIGLWFDIEEVPGVTEGPELVWEEWTGQEWLALRVTDETAHLALPGRIAFVWSGAETYVLQDVLESAQSHVALKDGKTAALFSQGDPVFIAKGETGEVNEVAAVVGSTVHLAFPLSEDYTGGVIRPAGLTRFGTPRAWVRVRLRDDGDPRSSIIHAIHLNAVWARQCQIVADELLGGGSGQENQTLFLRETPILDEPVIEVRELDGIRADVEWPLLQSELLAEGMTESEIRLVTNDATGVVEEVWVAWRSQPTLLFSGSDDRHFVLERVQGRIQFGDGRRGKIPPAGANNIRVASYQAGGGSRGNVAIDAISQILGAVPSAESVTNPLMAEGGSEPESFEGVEERGTAIMRNRGQAISRDDFEAIALSTSTSVAVARALPVTRADGISRAGCVQVVILPRSGDARPLPSYGLRRQVLRHLQARCPATAASRLSVVGPTYLPVDVSVQAAALNPDATGEVIARIEDAIAEFLHPLHGGPLGKGWCFGREMHLSDLAARLEGLEGVDYLHSLEFLLQGALQGDSVAVPADRIICAGDIAVLGAGGDL